MDRAGKALNLLNASKLQKSSTSDQPKTNGLSTSLKTTPNTDNLLDWDSWDPMGEDFNSSKNTPLASNPDKDPLSTITTGERRRRITSKIGKYEICDRYLKFGECADSKFCSKMHIQPKDREKLVTLQNQYETNKDRTVVDFTYLSPFDIEPDPNNLILVSVTNASSPSNFYLVAPYEKMNFSTVSPADLSFFIGRVYKSSPLKTKLEKCHDQLAYLFEHAHRIDNINDEINLSQIVACKLRDGRYRRAMVLATPDVSQYEINYRLLLLDVGIEVELPRELIFDIKASCMSDPPMALNCRLQLEPVQVESGWSKTALECFQKETRSESYLFCRVLDYVQVDNMFEVDLICIKTGKSLSTNMISSGLAQKCFV